MFTFANDIMEDLTNPFDQITFEGRIAVSSSVLLPIISLRLVFT